MSSQQPVHYPNAKVSPLVGNMLSAAIGASFAEVPYSLPSYYPIDPNSPHRSS